MAAGNIENRGGAYRARYRSADGRHITKTFRKKGDAQRWLATQLASVATGAWIDPKAGKVTFGDYAAAWAAQQPHRPATVRVTASRLRHVLPLLGDRPMAAVRTTEVRALVATLSKTLAPATTEAIYRLVATIFRAAVDDRVISSTPCRNVALPRPDGAEVVPLTVEEVGALVEGMPHRYRAGLVAAAGLGVRQGELFGLTVDRVDWLRRTVRVDRQLLGVEPGGLPVFGPPKTPASVRTVPAPTVVLEALTEHLRTFGEGPQRLVLTTGNGTPVRRGLAAATWRAAAIRAALPEASGWHAARHFYASALIAGGESVKVVQKRLGHKSAMETLDTYGHLWPDSEESTRAALDRLLGPTLGLLSSEPLTHAPMARPQPGG